MKRSYMTAILFILVLAFGLTACGGAKNNKESCLRADVRERNVTVRGAGR